MEGQSNKKRVRDESSVVSELVSPEVKRIREDLLGTLDDSDPDQTNQDLDSVMKSFEEEISASSSSPAPVVDLTSEVGESQPDLGYLLEASDDELGLPPTSISCSSEEVKNEGELVRVDSADSVGVGELWKLEEQIPGYDSFEMGTVENYNIEYAPFDDGLFEYSNVYFDSSEFPDYLWRLGTMPGK